MDFYDLLKKRYSVRAYKPDAVEEDKLERILSAAMLAPTAANRQAFQVIVATTAGREFEFRKIYNKDWFVQAPLILTVCAISGKSWSRSDGKNYCDVDAAIVMDHIILAATAEGLGSCWIAAFDPAAARDVLKIPDQMTPVVFTPLGYPDDQPRDKKRKPIAELTRINFLS